MKKGVIRFGLFILILSVLLSSGIFAAAPASGTCGIVTKTDCDALDGSEGYIVMGLSAATNAHGEFPSASYPYVLCCNLGTGSTTCITTPSSNKLIGLSSSTNAHAEIPSLTNYLTKVCYEDFKCGKYTTCPTDYPLEILSLSADTNAHISNFSGTGSYTTKICCGSVLASQSTCTITSASWNIDTAEEGQRVYLQVTGSGAECSGVSVSFNVWEDDGAGARSPVTAEPSNVAFNGDTARSIWYAEWQDDGILGGNPEYYFNASLTNNPEVSKKSSNQLTVTQQNKDFCSSITTCEDYKNEQDCNSDAGLCNVAKVSGNGIVDCNSDKIICGCIWDSTTGCGFGYSEINPGADCDPATNPACCEPGETLCSDNVCRKECTSANCNNNGVCDTGEGCSCIDCDKEQDSCDSGAVCSESFGACACNYGFTLCKTSSGILYCNLGNTCPAGESPTSLPENQNGSCDFGIDGCLSSDCPDGSQDTCALGAYCMNEKCSSVEIPITLGNCKITQEVITDCEEGGGIKTIRITGTWTGGGACGEACQKCNAMDDTPLTVPCPAQIQLPFFDYVELTATIIIIALIYTSLILRRKFRRNK